MKKQLIIFLLGLSTGILAGIKLEESYSGGILDEEMCKTKAYYEKKMEIALNKYKIEGIKNPESNINPDDWYEYELLDEEDGKVYISNKEAFKNIVEDELPWPEQETEEQMYSFPNEEEEIIMDTVEIDGEEYDITNEEEKDICKNPYIITEEEFSSEKLHYDKISAVYYADGTLVDEDEEMIEINDTVGYDALDELVNNETVYVRNERLGIDYMVTQTNNSYADYILGNNYDEDDGDNNRRRRVNDEG